jgi:hypothetical protein
MVTEAARPGGGQRSFVESFFLKGSKPSEGSEETSTGGTDEGGGE